MTRFIPAVVATVYGWWQACQELNLNGHDPFTQNGANTNLLIPNSDVDPISASVAHRGPKMSSEKRAIEADASREKTDRYLANRGTS